MGHTTRKHLLLMVTLMSAFCLNVAATPITLTDTKIQPFPSPSQSLDFSFDISNRVPGTEVRLEVTAQADFGTGLNLENSKFISVKVEGFFANCLNPSLNSSGDPVISSNEYCYQASLNATELTQWDTNAWTITFDWSADPIFGNPGFWDTAMDVFMLDNQLLDITIGYGFDVDWQEGIGGILGNEDPCVTTPGGEVGGVLVCVPFATVEVTYEGPTISNVPEPATLALMGLGLLGLGFNRRRKNI